jgi:hypothetical protein
MLSTLAGLIELWDEFGPLLIPAAVMTVVTTYNAAVCLWSLLRWLAGLPAAFYRKWISYATEPKPEPPKETKETPVAREDPPENPPPPEAPAPRQLTRLSGTFLKMDLPEGIAPVPPPAETQPPAVAAGEHVQRDAPGAEALPGHRLDLTKTYGTRSGCRVRNLVRREDCARWPVRGQIEVAGEWEDHAWHESGAFGYLPNVFTSDFDLIPVEEETPVATPFDPGKACRTRDGRPARIVSTKSGDKTYPLIAVIGMTDGSEDSETYTACGHARSDLADHRNDLVNVEEAHADDRGAEALKRIDALLDAAKSAEATGGHLKVYRVVWGDNPYATDLIDAPAPERLIPAHQEAEAAQALKNVEHIKNWLARGHSLVTVTDSGPWNGIGICCHKPEEYARAHPTAEQKDALETVRQIKQMLGDKAAGNFDIVRDDIHRCGLNISPTRPPTAPRPDAGDAVHNVNFIKQAMKDGRTVLTVGPDDNCWNHVRLQSYTPEDYAKAVALLNPPDPLIAELREAVERFGKVVLTKNIGLIGGLHWAQLKETSAPAETPKPLPFDPSKPCRTRDGRVVRVLSTGVKSQRPIVAVIEKPGCDDVTACFYADGWINSGTGAENPSDLVNDPPLAPKEHVFWLQVWSDGHATIRKTLEEINRKADNVVALARVVIPEGRFDEEPTKTV